MAEQNIGLNTKGLISTNDLSAYQYHFVQVDTVNARSCIIGSSGCEIAGVLQNKPKAGEMAIIATGPQPKVVAGEAIILGEDIMSGALGVAVASTGTNPIAGKALTTASAGVQIDGTYEVVQFDSKISGQ